LRPVAKRGKFLEAYRNSWHRGSVRRAFCEWFPPVNWVDLTVLIAVALFGLRGFFRGFFREIFSLVGLVAGFMVAVAYERPAAALVAAYWPVSPMVLKGAVFIAIFFAVYFLLNLIGWSLHLSERLWFLKILNRSCGIAIGMGKGTAIAALAVFLLNSSSLLSSPLRERFAASYATGPLSQLASNLIRIGKEKVFAGEGASPRPTSNAFRL
jgi:membrane protein required for colicin V production